jgi:DNA-binding MarR family transcriptional regulator
MSVYLANLLGAVSLATADRISASAEESLGLGGQTAPALVLIAMSPRVTIKSLAGRLKLSHAGAVRMVDRLEEEDLVKRVPSEDRREVRLVLTRKGAAAHDRLRSARRNVLADVISALTAAQKAALEPILIALMRDLTCDAVTAWTNCRLCDAETCAARGCPVAAWEQAEA